MLKEKLKSYSLILASASPRRQLLLKELDIDFKVEVRPVDETFPQGLNPSEVANYLSQLKASAFTNLAENDILITSDTIVWHQERILGKPLDYGQAKNMLQDLSGGMHKVVTSVCFTSKSFQKTITDITQVWFKELSNEEINYYIQTYQPFDKAGGYGIQEWIGYIGIERIHGCYFNVMGLPLPLVYKTLTEIATR